MEKLLIIYSNPADTERIRLDREHRAIDEVLRSVGLPASVVIRRHATTFKDLATAVAETDFTVFHFSGHGTPKGIYLEEDKSESGAIITADKIVTLLKKAQPRLKLAVFMSCFSASAIPVLVEIAPYLLTVFGPADDDASIEFVKAFYDRYLRDGSVPRACYFAEKMVDSELKIVLSRRAIDKNKGKTLFEVFPGGNYTSSSFLIDLGPAERYIANLGVSREAFLHTLSRKIRLHQQIFNSPRERAFLPIGPYVGVLSWLNAHDVITCHAILKIKPDVEQDASDTWVKMVVVYNDDAMQRYRFNEQPAAPYNYRALESSLKKFRDTYDWLQNTSPSNTDLRNQPCLRILIWRRKNFYPKSTVPLYFILNVRSVQNMT